MAKMLQLCKNPECEKKISFAFSLCMKHEEKTTHLDKNNTTL